MAAVAIDDAWIAAQFPKVPADQQKRILDALHAELVTTTQDLAVAVRSSGWADFKLPLLAKGTLESLVPSAISVEERFVSHLEEESTKAAEPWRRANQSATREIKRLIESVPQELKDEIITNLKIAALDEFEVLYVLSARILATDEDKKFYDALFVRYGTFEARVVAHNWFVANAIGASFLDQHGAKIAGLAYPLLPQHVVPEFAIYNAQLLTIGAVSGAGPSANVADRPAFLAKKPKHSGGVTGAGVLPVLADVNGNPVVDVGEIEHAWIEMKKTIATQQRDINTLKKQRAQNQAVPHRGAGPVAAAAPAYQHRGRGAGRGTPGGRGGRGISGSGPTQDDAQPQVAPAPPPGLPTPPQPGMVWDPVIGWRF
jgi:hypothetical protein